MSCLAISVLLRRGRSLCAVNSKSTLPLPTCIPLAQLLLNSEVIIGKLFFLRGGGYRFEVFICFHPIFGVESVDYY